MNPFEKFGLRHLSPSSLNGFLANPALWVGKYLLGWSDDPGPSARRGQAIEAGLDMALFKLGDEKSQEAATLKSFADLTNGIADEAHEKERENLVPMLHQARIALKDYSLPLSRQMKVEFWADGVEVPIIGYYDLLFQNEGIDLKTTLRIPSEMRPEHKRQLALYSKTKDVPFTALYVSPKKSSMLTLPPSEVDGCVGELVMAARAVQHLLRKSDNPLEAAKFYAPDYGHFHWSDETKKLARQIWT